MSEKSKSKRATIVMIMTVVLTIVLAGGAMFFFSRTLISVSMCVLPSVALGFTASYLLRRVAMKVSGSDNFMLNFAFQGVLLSALFAFLFLGGNFAFAGSGHHSEEVTVERLFTETRHRSKRVGRRYVSNGEPYKVYYMEIAFPDGRRKEIQLGQRGYGRHKKGETFNLEIETGLFGIPVIKSDLYTLIRSK